MNSRSKPTGPRKTGTRSRKPATIDLEAKKVEGEAADKAKTPASTVASKSASNKSESTSKTLGREGATQAAEKRPAEKPTSSKATKADDAPQSKSDEKAPTGSTPEPVKKSGGGFFSGLMGAAAAIAGLGVVGQYDGAKELPFIGALYSGEAGQTAGNENSAQIENLTQQVEALRSSSTPIDLAPINERLAEIEAAVGGNVDEATANRLAAVEASLAEVSQTLSSIAQAAEAGEGASSSEIAAAITTVTQRIEKLEGSVGELASSNTTPAAETVSKLAEIEATLTEMASSPGVDLSPLETKIGEIETSIASLKAAVDANAKGVEGLSAESSTLQETVASVKASEKVARSVAVNALGAALENDDPISLAIASIESLGGQTPETTRLAELSKEGVPTQKSLLSELDAFTDTIQNPVADPGSGSISDRFWANAKNLVTFRSSGPLEGNSAVAILSRVKANLEIGNLSDVIAEWEKLPAETRKAGEEWFNKVNKRVEAFSLYETLSNTLATEAG